MSNGHYVERVWQNVDRYARELLDENHRLRESLGAAEAQTRKLADELASHACSGVSLIERVGTLEADRQRREKEFAMIARQNANLANLYVASCGLHATLERRKVLGGIEEIVVNLIGSEEYAILELDAQREPQVIASMGVDPSLLVALTTDAAVRRALSTGQTVFQVAAPIPMVACIPLRLGAGAFGAIAVLSLLPQKAGLQEIDRELIDLLSEQAGTALFCSRLYENVRELQSAVVMP